MKPSLQFRLSQHLTLTPQLQQSIRLLQLSTVELNQEIDRILMENPALEREDAGEDVDTSGEAAPAGGTVSSTPPAEAPAAEAPAAPDADWSDVASNWSTHAVPGPNDDVTVAVAGTVTHSAATQDSVHSMTVSSTSR